MIVNIFALLFPAYAPFLFHARKYVGILRVDHSSGEMNDTNHHGSGFLLIRKKCHYVNYLSCRILLESFW